tara:strand:- start:3494 stop:4048 length:555 start_codon:yes stop_codon:yes gene_type:complete
MAQVYDDCTRRMQESVNVFIEELKGIRSGRAHPSILHSIKVDAYGTPTALQHVASISVDDARTLSVAPYDKSLMEVVEKAIRQSDLGLNPAAAGTIIRVPMPALSSERRVELVKLVKSEGEKTKVAVRNIRRDIISDLKDSEKNKVISEDDLRRHEVQIQKITDKMTSDIDVKVQEKEKEISTV